MTTIAANRRMMAGDQKVTDGDKRFHAHKLRRIGEAIVGAAGTGPAIKKFFAWLEEGQQDDPPKMSKDDELDALVLTPAVSFLFEGEVQFAIYNGGTKDAYEFKTKEACERVRDEQLANIDKVLTAEAKLIDLRCVGRNGGA